MAERRFRIQMRPMLPRDKAERPYEYQLFEMWVKGDDELTVPWSVVEDHERQAQSNHGQTLQRLDNRWGVSPYELYCIIYDTGLFTANRWNNMEKKTTDVEGVSQWLLDKMKEWN